MKASYRRIMKWLREGARIWGQRGLAWVCLPNGHPDDGKRVRRSTLQGMVEEGLIVNQFGVWNEGTEYSDNIWTLPDAKNK